MARSREGMEGFYLTCKTCPYFPIRLAEAGAMGEAGTGSREINAIAQGPSFQIHLHLEILTSQCSSSASHGQDNATVNVEISSALLPDSGGDKMRLLYLLVSQWLTWLILELLKWRHLGF
ncbi:hypothetical protein SUGI_0284130 [Cryptomeria japonica]|nr:hypothetical protein SUGI_0284130 [Cryptomeria japonica]